MAASIALGIRFNATSSGAGSFVDASAVTGYRRAVGNLVNGKSYRYRAENNTLSEWEWGTGVWNSGTSTLTRTVTSSSTGGTVAFTAAPQVAITIEPGDVLSFTDTMTLTTTEQNLGRLNLGINLDQTASDFNAVTATGNYTLNSSATNGPYTGASWWLEVVSSSAPANFVSQIATLYSGAFVHDEKWMRTKQGGTWTAWKLLLSDTTYISSNTRIGITNDTAAFSPGATVHIKNNNHTTCGLRVSSYWTGTTALPYQNNDNSLWEVFNNISSSSLNRSWAISAANAYNNIPAGVTDTGNRYGVLGWAVSVNATGYNHAGTLAAQFGVYGRAGFQGTGSASGAIIQSATGVRGEVINDSTGSIIQTGIAGTFAAYGYTGTVQNNYAVFAQAQGGTVANYSFYGAAGDFYNNGEVTTSGYGHFQNSGTEMQLFNNGTNCGVATNSARSAGQYMAINGSTWSALSDARIKIIREKISVLDRVDSFNAYIWENKLTGQIEFGCISQELVKDWREFVNFGCNDDPDYVPTGIDDPAMWGITGYERMGAYAMVGVKELKKQNEELRSEINELRRMVQSLLDKG